MSDGEILKITLISIGLSPLMLAIAFVGLALMGY